MTAHSTAEWRQAVRSGRRLEYFTIAYNLIEGLASLIAGWMAGSVSLVGFGLDSVIEVTSGAAVLWRLEHDREACGRERLERASLRMVGGCFLALALYILFESGASLAGHQPPRPSVPGIAVAAASLVVMPLLARAKRRAATRMGSGALRADARQADFCTWLSAILLGGLLLNKTLGWWWADPAAALVMAPIIIREGVNGLCGRDCCWHAPDTP
ncbi:MAG: cation transporter [Acidobacteriia bacterium]|nr:cation transporter [Terriglobia bacterium]